MWWSEDEKKEITNIHPYTHFIFDIVRYSTSSNEENGITWRRKKRSLVHKKWEENDAYGDFFE